MNDAHCDLCGSHDAMKLLSSFDRLYHISPELFSIVRCGQCGLVYTEPRPAAEALLKYYPRTQYYAYDTKKAGEGFMARVRKRALLAVLQEHYRFPTGPERRGLRLLDKVVAKVFQTRYPGFPLYVKRARILDVGCGDGSFLSMLCAMDFEGYGIEVDAGAVERAKQGGLRVFQGTLESVDLEQGFFDYVRFSHVLEHVQSPSSAVREAHRILKRNGMAIVLVPNIASANFSLFKKYWFHLDLPRHLFQFSPKTISQLLTANGFTNIKIRRYTAEQSLLGSLAYCLEEIGLLHKHRDAFINHRILNLLLLPLIFLQNICGYGDLLEVRATKC